MKYLILFTTILLLCSCNKFEGEIYSDSDSQCRDNSGGEPLPKAKSYFVRNTSSTKAYIFTIKVTSTGIDSDDNISPFTRTIELLPGEEKFLGCSPAPGSRTQRISAYELKETLLGNLNFEFEIVGQLEKKP
jgi:hypothetical protein